MTLADLTLAAARLVEAVAPGSPITEGFVLAGSVAHRFTSRTAGREFGYCPRQRLEDAIADCIAFNLRQAGAREGR